MAEILPTLLAAAAHPEGESPPPAIPPAPVSTVVEQATPTRLISPALSRKLEEKINTGEYIELSELLPSVCCSAAARPAPRVIHLEMAEGGPICIVDSTLNRGKGRHMHGLVKCLEAYTVLLHASVRTAPMGRWS